MRGIVFKSWITATIAFAISATPAFAGPTTCSSDDQVDSTSLSNFGKFLMLTGAMGGGMIYLKGMVESQQPGARFRDNPRGKTAITVGGGLAVAGGITQLIALHKKPKNCDRSPA